MKSNINIAFCFDENMMRQACVTISSLLDSKEEDTHYNIYCVCSKEALRIQKYLCRLISRRDAKSKLIMKQNMLNYDNGYEVRGITVSTYFRLHLHILFPDINKIIYSDVDILFQGDLRKVWETDLKDNYFAGVKADVNIKEVWNRHLQDDYWKDLSDWFGKYVNAGFLLLNLRKIRDDEMHVIWEQMLGNQYFFQDQDILNLTCKPNISFLPMEFNRFMFYSDNELDELRRNLIVTRAELDRALKHPTVIHYAGGKPWKKFSVFGAKMWWDYVKSQSDLCYILRAELFCYKFYRLFTLKGR